jgi:hypothetical protein
MIKRKFYLTVVFGILGIVIFYLLFFFIYTSISKNRLNTIEGKSNFDIATILSISKDSITTENETYNKGEFIEYDCIIDNTYYISIIKVGEIGNITLSDSLCFENQFFPSREGWFNYEITTPHPMANMIPINYIPWYNVFLLPFKEINKINIFIDGEIFKKEWLNSRTLSYSLGMSHAQFSFNNMNKVDLEFSPVGIIKQPPFSNIFFIIDENHNLYIGCTSTNIGNSKTLSEIIDKM